MSQQIIKQPDGKYSLFSTVVDDFILTDATADDIIAFRVREETEHISNEVHKIIAKLESNDPPYHQFTLTYQEALECRAAHQRRLV